MSESSGGTEPPEEQSTEKSRNVSSESHRDGIQDCAVAGENADCIDQDEDVTRTTKSHEIERENQTVRTRRRARSSSPRLSRNRGMSLRSSLFTKNINDRSQNAASTV